jgi:uncharacterized protein YidB (DUF937 family)
MELGASLLKDKLGGAADVGKLKDALGGLVGEGSKLDIGGLLKGMQEGGLADVAKSWLGDGENAGISADQVQNLIGADKIKEMAAKVGSDAGSLVEGLKNALPQMVDKASSGGNLLDSIGGLGGLTDMAKKFMK